MSVINGFISKDESDRLFQNLKTKVQWNVGIPTRNGGISRLQSHFQMIPYEIQCEILEIVNRIFSSDTNNNYNLEGIYLNYYRNGNDYCPRHKHDSRQCIISLGSPRHITINNKKILLEPGSVCIFNNEYHSVDRDYKSGERISIVIFFTITKKI